MKTIKITAFALLSVLASCEQKKEKGETVASDGTESTKIAGGSTSATNNPDGDKIITQKMIDSKTGEIYATMELPANWQLNTKSASMAESNYGVKLYYLPAHPYVFYQDQYSQQMYIQAGGKPRDFVSIQTLIDQDLMPVAKKEGSRFVRQYELPEVAAADKRLDDMMYKAMPSQQQFRAVMTEWIDAKGNPYAMIIHQNGSVSNGMIMWNYFCHAIEATKEWYEKGKTAAIRALASTVYNPKFFMAYNQSEANKASASWANHNRNMQQKQAAFETHQRNHVANSDAVSQSIMKSYNDNQTTSDRMHNRFVNYIKDENTVTNNVTGTRHQVETGGNEYWMNNDGKYVKSNDPNRDPSINNKTWDNTTIED